MTFDLAEARAGDTVHAEVVSTHPRTRAFLLTRDPEPWSDGRYRLFHVGEHGESVIVVREVPDGDRSGGEQRREITAYELTR